MSGVSGAAGERRLAPRLHGEGLPDDLRGRVRPGYAVRVVDLSPTGALLECRRRLLPGSAVDVLIECCGFRHVTRATVVRCQVGALLPQCIVFRAAVEFDCRLEQWQGVPEPVPLDGVPQVIEIAVA